MKPSNLNFGTIGRCGCRAIGKRRATFADEPICDACLPTKSGFLHVMTVREAEAFNERTVGQLTPAQRKARVEWLTKSYAREAALLEEQADIHGAAVIEEHSHDNSGQR